MPEAWLYGIALATGHLAAAAGATSDAASVRPKVRICAVIAGRPADRSWTLPETKITEVRNRLAAAQSNLGNVEFVIGQASTAEETSQLLAKAGPGAPVLAISADIFGLSRGVMPTVFKEGRPVAVFHVPVIGGHGWCLVNPWREQGNRITLFDSSDLDELERAAALLRVILGNAAGVDTARNAFHLSHCSAPLKMEGPDGPTAPYLLRWHAEVRGGAVTEVHYRLGQKVTFTKMIHLDTLLVVTGRIIEVPEVPQGKERGCRTELVAEVEDADRLLANWGGGALGPSATDYYASLHRVAYYGDHTRTIRHLGHLLGLKVVQEA